MPTLEDVKEEEPKKEIDLKDVDARLMTIDDFLNDK